MLSNQEKETKEMNPNDNPMRNNGIIGMYCHTFKD